MNPTKIGELLVASGKLTQENLEKGLELQATNKGPLGRILMANNWIGEHDVAQALSFQFGHRFIELTDNPPEALGFLDEEVEHYIKYGYIHLREKQIAVCQPTLDSLQWIRSRFADAEIFIAPENQLFYYIHLYSEKFLSGRSVMALSRSFPDYSAAQVFTGLQLVVIYLVMSALLFLFVFKPVETLTALNILLTLFLFSSFIFKFSLAWVGSVFAADNNISAEEIKAVEMGNLPNYTILVPMYKEPEVVPSLIKALRAISYPLEKLDIKLILEADDELTPKALALENLPPQFDVIIVPHSHPKTKPKACNYALNFAKGEYTAIYDAEDRPDPFQLKKALACFARSGEETAVVQARLNWFNSNENWITRLFTQEYSLWFDLYLPALDFLKVPIPLGGTSNHFKTSVLRAVGAWDPFNVTEDADLGIRLYQMGYQVKVINSTTYEEAVLDLRSWIRQRSRWLKGYLQTYLVHSRSPIDFYKKVGFRGAISFHFFIGGTFIMAISMPFLYFLFFFWLFSKTAVFEPYFPDVIGYLSLINLLVGNLFFIFIQTLGLYKRKLFALVPWAILTPVYWLMLSMAAMKALYQLFTNPFYWEKTQHGFSKVSPK